MQIQWRQLLRRLVRDDRGETETVSWLITQIPFWFLVTLVIVVSLVGVKQAATASLAHLTARRAGTATLAAGQSVAVEHGAVWRIPGEAAQVQADPGRRSVVVDWAYTWEGRTLAARFLAPFDIEVRERERAEGFYAGPPDLWE
jgi:hypothetical protein